MYIQSYSLHSRSNEYTLITSSIVHVIFVENSPMIAFDTPLSCLGCSWFYDFFDVYYKLLEPALRLNCIKFCSSSSTSMPLIN